MKSPRDEYKKNKEEVQGMPTWECQLQHGHSNIHKERRVQEEGKLGELGMQCSLS